MKVDTEIVCIDFNGQSFAPEEPPVTLHVCSSGSGTFVELRVLGHRMLFRSSQLMAAVENAMNRGGES